MLVTVFGTFSRVASLSANAALLIAVTGDPLITDGISKLAGHTDKQPVIDTLPSLPLMYVQTPSFLGSVANRTSTNAVLLNKSPSDTLKVKLSE